MGLCAHAFVMPRPGNLLAVGTALKGERHRMASGVGLQREGRLVQSWREHTGAAVYRSAHTHALAITTLRCNGIDRCATRFRARARLHHAYLSHGLVSMTTIMPWHGAELPSAVAGRSQGCSNSTATIVWCPWH